jgi:hypothetical protein
MSGFTRIAHRTATYAEWVAQNNNTPGGLKLMQGEICVIIADQASAAAGLSNPVAQPGPLAERFANTGEVLGTKIGNGANLRWDETPTNYHIPKINYGNGGGRVLGTRENGATHVYDHPGKMFQAIFAPVYSRPEVAVNILSNSAGINGAVYEVGQDIANVQVFVAPSIRSYPIKRGRAYEENPSNGARTQLGADETANSPNTIGSFSRSVPAFEIVPGNSTRRGDGYFVRRFFADVTDTRPSNEGGEVTAESGRLEVYAAFPTFFGKTTQPLPAGEAARGTFLQANCTPTIIGRQNFNSGSQIYTNGERPVFAYPASYGPLRDILDVTGSSQLGYTGAAFRGGVLGKITKAGFYTEEPMLIYETVSGFNGDQFFNFVF